MDRADWASVDGDVAKAVVEQTARCLEVYRKDSRRILSDANLEVTTSEGGYGRKQVYELIQNGADALLGRPGRIEVLLTMEHLYVANEGVAIDVPGVLALMGSHLSQKRGEEIGRFGLGFKSVIAVSDRPEVISRSGSFGFDRAWAEDVIASQVQPAPRYPVLRLAQPLDPSRVADGDPALASLMSWATTIVRSPLKAGHRLLSEDLKGFPAEFLLFSPHVARLDIVDTTTSSRRCVTLTQQSDGQLLLDDAGDAARWRVVRAAHNPSPAAAKDAGELTNRSTINLLWAVPMQNRSRVGRFWAFFPTESQMTLSGIANAPWKLSDDRRNLLEGTYNKELLVDVLPGLVSRSFTALVAADDPAGVLDLLPARGKEARNWADDEINNPIFEALSTAPSLPSQDGSLRRPHELKLHPKNLKAEWLAQWAQGIGADAARWVHHGVDRTPERRLKAERLAGASYRQPDVTEWLEALCEDPTVANSTAALVLAARMATESPEHRDAARAAKILLLEDGRRVPPRSGTVFVRAGTQDDARYDYIEPELVKRPGVRDALAVLGIQVLDRSGELRAALTKADQRLIEWERVWPLCRQIPRDLAEDILRERLPAPLELTLRVRNAEGRWVALGDAYVGGGVVPADGSRDRTFLIDPRYHAADTELLRDLGAVSAPALRRGVPEEPWLTAYKDACAGVFMAKAQGSKPAVDKLVVEGPMPPWPLDPLSRLSPAGRAALTGASLVLDPGEKWVVRHVRNTSYGRLRFQPPVVWWLQRHGMLRTAFGPWPTSSCLRPDKGWPEDVLPVPDVSAATADALGLVEDPTDLPSNTWRSMLAIATTWPDDARRYHLYAWAVHLVDAPSSLRIRVGNRLADFAPRDVAVTADPEVERSLTDQQVPVIRLEDPDDVSAMLQRWKLADAARLLQQELVTVPVGEPDVLVDRYPALRLWLDPSSSMLELQLCESIALVTATPRGQISRPVPGALVDGRVCVTGDDAKAQLRQISFALKMELGPEDIQSILDQQEHQRAQELMSSLRSAGSLEERLAILIGGEALRRSVPATALDALQQEGGSPMGDVDLARLAHAVHGVGVLQHFRSVLEERKLNPPAQWAGRSAARRFVREMGFSPDYAGFPSDRRPAVFDVDGPAVLGPLHDYQEAVTGKIKKLLAGDGPARGLVSLPTGAGKTRVAVQALVDEVRDGRLGGPVVWIAQGDELCEQAVETWAYVWRAAGPRDRMVISRFWSNNEVTEEPDAFQLVVATPEKLYNAVGKKNYDWMTTASIVIVDEAHVSIAPMYTDVLNWLGRGRSRAERRPLIGLSATPFRNTNVEETKRLIGRYDGNRLDDGAFDGDPYAELQARGVLAQVEQKLLDGVDVRLTREDKEEIDKYKRLPARVENRLGESVERNRRIVESIVGLPGDWPVLLFATSVENARALAAQLTYAGVSAVAVSSETEAAARRHYVEQFQSGDLRVITNYRVLAQGFDAPAVRAVYVTRPTFSPNLYQQMIGRGLRGPRNGGSEQVRIVNVRDNLHQYGDKLAFYDFEHLWSDGDGDGDGQAPVTEHSYEGVPEHPDVSAAQDQDGDPSSPGAGDAP